MNKIGRGALGRLWGLGKKGLWVGLLKFESVSFFVAETKFEEMLSYTTIDESSVFPLDSYNAESLVLYSLKPRPLWKERAISFKRTKLIACSIFFYLMVCASDEAKLMTC